LISKESGFVSAGGIVLLIGGLALVALLVYGWSTGHELPLWPAIAVALVNIIGAAKIVLDTKKARELRSGPGSNASKSPRPGQ
jgi:hypothetical protein